MSFPALRDAMLGTVLTLGSLDLTSPARADYTFSSVTGPSGQAAFDSPGHQQCRADHRL